MNPNLVAALRRELDGYLRTGRVDRARQVVEQMALLGCDSVPFESIVPAEEASILVKPAKKAAPRKAKK